MAWGWGTSGPDISSCGRSSKSWWRPRCGWQWGHFSVMRLLTFTGWLCSPGSRTLTPSLSAPKYTAGPPPLVNDSEGLWSGLETACNRCPKELPVETQRLNMTSQLRITKLKVNRSLSESLHDDLTHCRGTGALGPIQTNQGQSCLLLTRTRG